MTKFSSRITAAGLFSAAVMTLVACSGTTGGTPEAGPVVSSAVTDSESSSAAPSTGTRSSSTSAHRTTVGPTRPSTSRPVPTADTAGTFVINTTAPESVRALDALNAGLLTAAEIGPEFIDGDYTPADPNDSTATGPCGGPTVANQFPYALRTGMEATAQDDNVYFGEAATLYEDADAAGDAFSATVDGFGCGSSATLGEDPAILGEPQDVTALVGGDEAQAWTLTTSGTQGVLIGVRYHALLIGFTFVAGTSADQSALPDAITVAEAATAKLLAATG